MILKIFIGLCSIFFSSNLDAKQTAFDLSSQNIKVDFEDSEPNLIIFGFKKADGFLILKIRGPQQKVILQNKKNILGMWTWQKSGEFTYPALYHYYTNAKSSNIDFKIKKINIKKLKKSVFFNISLPKGRGNIFDVNFGNKKKCLKILKKNNKFIHDYL